MMHHYEENYRKDLFEEEYLSQSCPGKSLIKDRLGKDI